MSGVIYTPPATTFPNKPLIAQRLSQIEQVGPAPLSVEPCWHTLSPLHPETTDQRRLEIERQLREYCKLDTFAMVRIWQAFAGKVALTNGHS